MRWSLVPLWAASSKVYHARAAFHYACWSSGEFHCTPGSAEYWRDCAEDRRGTAYRGGLRIPPHLPDGEYVLGFVWYGGYVGDHHSEYGDYYDCARVRVRGGVRQAGSFTPTWAPGRGEFHDSCRASVNRVGTCWREPCKGFQGGRLKWLVVRLLWRRGPTAQLLTAGRSLYVSPLPPPPPPFPSLAVCGWWHTHTPSPKPDSLTSLPTAGTPPPCPPPSSAPALTLPASGRLRPLRSAGARRGRPASTPSRRSRLARRCGWPASPSSTPPLPIRCGGSCRPGRRRCSCRGAAGG